MKKALVLPLAVLLAACGDSPDLASPSLATGGITAHAHGEGVFDAGVPVAFQFGIVQDDATTEAATGDLRFTTDLGGLAVDFVGQATCLAVDAANARAWIAGVITENNSTHPSFTGPLNQVGKDIWFRVVDYGEGAGAPQVDRTTFVGFEGSAGIGTSAEYCATRPWPDGDARTGPVLEGNIQVVAR
jgi:hypothetical protein